MGDYKKTSEKAADKELGDFPKIDVADCTEKVNALFTPYLFFERNRRGDVTYRCSACRRAGTVLNPPRMLTPELSEVLYARHNGEAACPLCGRKAKLKQTGMLGKKRKLLEYHPAVFLSERDGDLFARAYWARKDYQGELTAPPLFMLAGAYRFRPGEARYYYESYHGKTKVNVLTGNYDPVHRVITEPFTDRNTRYSECYVPYTVFGMENIGRSAFRYCQAEKFETAEDGLRWDLMKYLAACCLYPRQIEMLMKTGMESLVVDLVCRRRKNARIIRWGEEDPCKALGLTKPELREWRASGAPVQAIAWYKQLKRRKLPESFEMLRNIEEEMGLFTEDFLRLCRKYRMRPGKACRYFTKFGGCCVGARYGVQGLQPVYQHWRDHLQMAEALGYDMTAEPVLLPHDLYGRHDEEALELALKEAQEDECDAVRLARRKLETKDRDKKYNIEAGGYILRVAESAQEIVKEGINLQHCVGGYARRHMEGVLTILFLRRAEEPDRSLYTIEMNGNRLAQIHGYQNERDGAPNPRRTMAWLLDPWLEWVKKGSPRDEDGQPKGLNIRKEEVKVA